MCIFMFSCVQSPGLIRDNYGGSTELKQMYFQKNKEKLYFLEKTVAISVRPVYETQPYLVVRLQISKSMVCGVSPSLLIHPSAL